MKTDIPSGSYILVSGGEPTIEGKLLSRILIGSKEIIDKAVAHIDPNLVDVLYVDEDGGLKKTRYLGERGFRPTEEGMDPCSPKDRFLCGKLKKYNLPV